MARKHGDKWLAKAHVWDRATNGKARCVRAAERRTRLQGKAAARQGREEV